MKIDKTIKYVRCRDEKVRKVLDVKETVVKLEDDIKEVVYTTNGIEIFNNESIKYEIIEALTPETHPELYL